MVITRLEEVQKELEKSTDDMELMGKLLDELNDLQKKADRSSVYSLACVCRRAGALCAVAAADAAAPAHAGAKLTR